MVQNNLVNSFLKQVYQPRDLKTSEPTCANESMLQIVSEYDQSQTADNPVALRGRAAQPSRDTRKTN